MRVRGRRCLLNPPGLESTGAIVAEVEDTRGWKPGRFRLGAPLAWDDDAAYNIAPYATLQISNCDRSIAFSIRWDDAAERRGALSKVDRMISALSEFRDALVDEQRLYVARVAEAKRAGPPVVEEA